MIDSRRQFVRSVSGLGIAGLAGCTGILDDEIEHVLLVENVGEKRHDVTGIVVADEPIVHDHRTLDPGETWTVTTIEEPGSYARMAETEADSWESDDELPISDGETEFTLVQVETDGTLDGWTKVEE